MIPPQLDPIIHPPNRLHICAFLSPLEEAEFHVIRKAIDVSESVFSKQIAQLVQADYVTVRQGAIQGRARKWAALTKTGRAALSKHLEALRAASEEIDNAIYSNVPSDRNRKR